MNKLKLQVATLIFSALSLWVSAATAVDIAGAGATLPYPIYAKLAETYKSQTGMGLNYQPIGSGSGLQQVQSNTVDFCATDAPLSPSDPGLAGLIQFPILVGGVVPVVNLPGVAPGQLKLGGDVLADIFLGKIKKWNDRRIAVDNGDLALPDEIIKVLYRSDASGTTFIFTSYLAQINQDWARMAGSTVRWPVGTGGKGNEGVTSYVQRIKYSIGYVGFAYALQNDLTYTRLKNRDGQFVKPEAATFGAAAAYARWNRESGFQETLLNEPGKDSWPITGITYVQMQKTATKPESAREALKFFDWMFDNGDKVAAELHFVPLPVGVQAMVRSAWKTEIKSQNGMPLWK